ncbi:DegQ family serine endoprotease [Alloalcanivorax sp. C16-2]|uniref:DegQ family serine endoprotease n=1 Tax=Alloalcanivorax TaxID=3020832 RepID=UPI00193148BE|nr:DegQ family serine endoprotease [Alloalcanivorax marinus]MBL7251344.1 DegQ family serine endoprotease [Alloalcanivorax marinus]
MKQHALFAWAGAVLLAFSQTAGAALPDRTPDGGALPSLAPMIEDVSPAVVNIAIEAQVRQAQNPLMQDPFFRRFFDLPEQAPTRRAVAAGSGVIVDADKGYVLTNAHVARNADKIEVTLKDGRELSAELVGLDQEVDLAVLKLEKAEDLTQVKLADSSSLRVGDFVVAIGNPFGLGQTVTSGIVSALGRTGLGIEGYENFIQTDASINPGNSGGALVNLKGELVGINTAILAPSGGNVGIGFAIPTNMAENVMTQLIEHGEVRRGVLGVTVQDLSDELAEALDVEARKGVVITNVLEDSAAAEAGLKAGDVVRAVDGQPVNRASDLRNKVGLSPVGEKITLSILRDGKERRVTAVISESSQQAGDGDAVSSHLKGAAMRDLRQGELSHVDRGVLVENVERNSPAWRAGLRGGDVIINANRQDVASMDELSSAVKDKDAPLLLRVNREGGIFFVVVR